MWGLNDSFTEGKVQCHFIKLVTCIDNSINLELRSIEINQCFITRLKSCEYNENYIQGWIFIWYFHNMTKKNPNKAWSCHKVLIEYSKFVIIMLVIIMLSYFKYTVAKNIATPVPPKNFYQVITLGLSHSFRVEPTLLLNQSTHSTTLWHH